MNLAQKYRPKSFDDILSQEHLVGKGGIFKNFIKNSYFPNAIFYGEPGCGKTTMARVIAKELGLDFYEFNATSIKIDEVRKSIANYKNALTKPLIFIDEIHRLSKIQEEVLLPFMESGQIILIGASTQNPYYSLTSAFRSRSHLFKLNTIKSKDIKDLINRVIENEGFSVAKDAVEYIVNSSSGDARGALNLLESSVMASSKEVTLDIVKAIRKSALKSGSSESEEHYNLASALIKSIRGSDIDAAIYYLARLIDGGEPPEFIARRLSILASEDIGNANPNALNLAASVITIVEKIGYPEARIPLSQLTIYLASSPKSNSAYKAINSAIDFVKKGNKLEIPKNIKSNPEGYLYPHDYGGYIEQNYLTKSVTFYNTNLIGYEKTLNDWLTKIKNSNLKDKK